MDQEESGMAMHTDTMKAAAIDRFGGPDEFGIHTLSVPQVGPDEVLVQVDTAGVGEWDPWVREGEFAQMTGKKPEFPYVMGADGAGTVIRVGKNVKKFREGDKVYGYNALSSRSGFYAQYAAVAVDDLAPLPRGMSLEAAGAMPADAVTALCGLERLEIQPGDHVLIFGASGGIGHLAVQLAKRMGARVLAVASGADGVTLVRQLGADAVIDGHGGDIAKAAREFAPDGIDAALLTAGGAAADTSLASLRKGGRMAYPHGVEPEPKARDDIEVSAYDGRVTAGLYERLNRLIEAGAFTVKVASTYPLDQAGAAHRALGQHHLGKLALKVAES
jgi:NADPH:quinone reductase-like Zn-dependent oxidoreductase